MAVPKQDIPITQANRALASDALLLLLSLIIIVVSASIYVLYSASHNLYGSTYYTLSSITGLNEEGYSSAVLAPLAPNGYALYSVIAMLVIDGIVKYMIIGFGVAIALELITGVDIGSALLGIAKAQLNDHVIICGYSNLAEQLCETLKLKGERFVIIDKDAVKIEQIRERGYLPIEGDFTESDDLMKANIKKAKAAVFCGDSDFTNLLGIVTARNISKQLSIICRAKSENSVSKMHRAGAELCIVPELVAGLEIGTKLSGV